MSPKPKTICQKHAANLETLVQAAKDGNLVLLECIDKTTGEIVAVLCACWFDGKEYTFTPFAPMVNGDPYRRFLPPNPDGGFHE